MFNNANSRLTPTELAVCTATGVTPEAFSAVKAPPNTYQLSDEELAICRATGVSPGVFAATKATGSKSKSQKPSGVEPAVCIAGGFQLARASRLRGDRHGQ